MATTKITKENERIKDRKTDRIYKRKRKIKEE